MIGGRVCWFSGEDPRGGPAWFNAWGVRGATEEEFQNEVDCVVMIHSAEKYWVERYDPKVVEEDMLREMLG